MLVYLRTAEGNDALAWVDKQGKQRHRVAVRDPARLPSASPTRRPCRATTTITTWCAKGVELHRREEKSVGGQLGRPSGARFRTYERLKRYADAVKGTLFDSQELRRAIEDIYRYPLRQAATDTLNRQLRSGISDADLAELVIALREEDRLCIIHEEEEIAGAADHLLAGTRQR